MIISYWILEGIRLFGFFWYTPFDGGPIVGQNSGNRRSVQVLSSIILYVVECGIIIRLRSEPLYRQARTIQKINEQFFVLFQ